MPDLIDAVAQSIRWTEMVPRRGPLRTPNVSTLADPAEEATDGMTPDYRSAVADEADRPEQAAALRARAEVALTRARSAGIQAVPLGDPEYPLALAEIPDAPPLLWVRGELRPEDHAVAIVGSRAATPHALEVAFRLGEGLARAGVVVVSGLARGVDAAAHRGALSGEGRTLAVLGSGVDVIYPPEHADLAARTAGAGALLSELVPGTRPVGWHFPRRNRIISGLAAGVVVVEASAHSGSLITAARALDQGRTVMAVPGGVLSGRNRGAHGLLKDGARMVETVEDILEELHYVGVAAVLAGGAERGGAGRIPADPVLWAMKAGEPYDIGSLCAETGLDTVRMLSRLAELELGGWVSRAGGGRFVRLGTNVLR